MFQDGTFLVEQSLDITTLSDSALAWVNQACIGQDDSVHLFLQQLSLLIMWGSTQQVPFLMFFHNASCIMVHQWIGHIPSCYLVVFDIVGPLQHVLTSLLVTFRNLFSLASLWSLPRFLGARAPCSIPLCYQCNLLIPGGVSCVMCRADLPFKHPTQHHQPGC